MRLPGPSGHTFSAVPGVEIPRSSFDRSHGLKTTFDGGYLVPVFVDEVLPGDTFSLSMTLFGRLATPIFPVMDNLYLNSFFFFVPWRLIWNNFQKFMGEQTDPGDSTDFLVPQVTVPMGGFTEGSLFDYFGVATQVQGGPGAGLSVNAAWSRAYNLIYNEWFRDQNLQDSVVVDKDDGPDAASDYVLLRRGKRHDYFTSSLPWPQKGDAVELPLGTSAPVYGTGQAVHLTNAPGSAGAAMNATIGNPAPLVWAANSGGTQAMYFPNLASGDAPGLYADLSAATAATINQLRQAFQVQRMQERDARGGTRYIELIKSHFGVTSPDARLQRPEYLGGGQSMVNIAPVAQTSSTDATTPQGNLAAIGTVTAVRHGFTKSFTEHGVLLGLVSVRADLTYQQGTNRMWSRRTRYDFFWPTLANIGEQAVLLQEIFTAGTNADDDVFGYQERYGEYRYKPSLITGAFRSNAAATLDAWHLSQDFASAPPLNASFIVDNPPIARVVATPAEPEVIADVWFNLRCARPMPVFGVPGLIDHF